jgi:hypothetical protein
MSTSAGAGGVFGILLPSVPQVADLYADLKEHATQFHLENEEAGANDFPSFDEFETRFIAAFKNLGIIVPDGAQLLSTGTEDDCPAECSTPGDEFALGFGLFTPPWNYPDMDESFKRVAQWHTWAWAG